jgi:UDPglucose 6-dehydrogenase
MKKIAIVGCGFVGAAVAEGMKHAFEIYGHDVKLCGRSLYYWSQNGDRREVLKPNDERRSVLEYIIAEVDGPIFVSVPTPMRSDGSCDLSILIDVITDIDKYCSAPNQSGKVVVIKSTVPPGTTEKLNEKCEHVHVCFNPEFLREATAIDDFKNQDRIIIGGPHAGTSILKQMYQKAYPDVPTTKTSSTIAEMVKYVTNCFLATKVSFANEIYQICDALDIDYDKVIEYATKDKRLGTSHWAVPGPDGRFGFGLTCFPKDLNALIHLAADELNVDPKIMRAVWQKNLEVRPEKDWEQMKGRAVV